MTVNQRRELELILTNRTQFEQPLVIPAAMTSAVIFGTKNATSEVDTPAGEPYTDIVPGNGELRVKLWYEPPEVGMHQTSLDVKFCAAAGSSTSSTASCLQPVTLQGTGVKPEFALIPDVIDFGDIQEGDSKTESFMVQNIGSSRLVVEALNAESGTTQFSVAPQQALPATLEPGSSLTVAVVYTGDQPREHSDRIAVVTNAWNDPSTPDDETTRFVSLVGRTVGPDINPLPAAVSFGTVAIVGGIGNRNLLLENAGNTDLTITEIRLETLTPEIAITVMGGFPATVTPGATLEVQVTYDPMDAGADSAIIIVESDDPNEGTLPVPVEGIGGVPTTCAIQVAPIELTFGLVERGTQVTLPVEIRNNGAQPCTVSNVTLNGAMEFSLGGAPPAATIPPGSRQRVDITYAPTAYGMHNTLLEFDTDDPSFPNQSVPVRGQSAQSDIRVIPSQLDFNVVPVTCRSPRRAITIYNTGANRVTITNVALDPSTTPEFELTPFNTPSALAAGDSAIIEMRYHPRDIGVDTGVLFIEIDLGATTQRVAVPLNGDGQLNPTVTDEFQQLPTPQADVLFVVDNSCSMSEEQSSLGNNLASFLTFAQQEGIDFQIGVTTTDVDSRGARGAFIDGQGTNRSGVTIITPQTPNATGVFRTNTGLGTGGSGNEKGLEAAFLALSDPLINTTNGGFLRTDASLAVIVVSDEEDHSSRAVTFYENFLRNLKGFQNAGQFSFSAIVGTQQPSCRGAGGRADYAARYIQVAQTTGGVVESICNANWGQTLANIGLNSFGLKRQFILSSTPVPSTIAVSVQGTAIPSITPGGQENWAYAQATNSIDFRTGAVPEAGQTIRVTYTVACLP